MSQKAASLLVVAIGFCCLCAVIVGLTIFVVAPRLGFQLTGNILEASEDIEIAEVPFVFLVVDNTAGDIKLVGDIDGDTFPDLVLGGMPNEPLSWYRYPNWQKFEIAVADNEFTTDGALGDVDNDNDLDIVVPDGDAGSNLLWFENPLPNGDPTEGGEWQRHVVGGIGSWGKDVELADFDSDGRLDVATRVAAAAMIFFQTGPDEWQESRFGEVRLGNEGMASGDVNGDDHIDIILRGVWLRNPGATEARMATSWSQYQIGTAHTDFKALVVDLNQDGIMDVLFSSSEGTADVDWWTPETGDPTGKWVRYTILSNVERAHTLQAADMDLDGDLDVIVAQMHTSAKQQIMILLNDGGGALSWSQQVVDEGGLHNGVVADIGKDCDFDIYGANWAGNPPVRLWENQLDSTDPLERWTYKQITSSHAQTFGLVFGDIDGDGLPDVISGRYWYLNPGKDLLGDWVQAEFPDGMHALLASDIDGDAEADLIAQKGETDIALYWLEASEKGNGPWSVVKIGTVDQASHELGTQGYRAAQLEGNEQPEILVSSGNGIYYFRIPNDPESGNWPRIHVNGNPSDEGFDVGDIDGDGAPDIAATTGDSKRVEWYRNPGNGSGEWPAFHIGEFAEALFPDRTEVADLNLDGRVDIIVTEENGTDTDAQTFWWEQPEDPTSPNWARNLVADQGTTNSLDTADMDGDGDIDLILAEHRGALRISVWVNNGTGVFAETVVGEGHENHLGGRLVDLDGDGDLDIVGIAWDDAHEVHLWRNDQVGDLCTK